MVASMIRFVKFDLYSTILCQVSIIDILIVKIMPIVPHKWEQMHLLEMQTMHDVILLITQALIKT